MKKTKMNENLTNAVGVAVPIPVLAAVTDILALDRTLECETKPLYAISSLCPNAAVTRLYPIRKGEPISKLASSHADVDKPDVFINYSEKKDGTWEYVWKKYFNKTKYLNFEKFHDIGCGLFKFEDTYIVSFGGVCRRPLDGWDESIENAIDFMERFKFKKSDDVIITGHSLGGAIAQTIGKMYSRPTITFNALGARNIATGLNTWDDFVKYNIHYFTNMVDPKLIREVKDYLLKGGIDADEIDFIVDKHKFLAKQIKPKKKHWFLGLMDEVFGEKEVEIDVSEVKRRTHGVGAKLLKYYNFVERLITNEAKVVNYVIAGDPVASIQRHYGELVIIHDKDGLFRYNSNISLKDYSKYRRHPIGFFLPHCLNDWDIDPIAVRPAMIRSIVALMGEVNERHLVHNYLYEILSPKDLLTAKPSERCSNIGFSNLTLGYRR